MTQTEIHLRKKVNPDLYFIPYAKINFRARTVPNVKYKIKLSEENIKEYQRLQTQKVLISK